MVACDDHWRKLVILNSLLLDMELQPMLASHSIFSPQFSLQTSNKLKPNLTKAVGSSAVLKISLTLTVGFCHQTIAT